MALILNVNTSAAATDNVIPTVVATDPANHTIIPTSKTIKVTYTEPIKTAKPWIVLKNTQGTVIPTTSSVYNRTLSVTPTSNLPSGVNYILTIHSGSITDAAGNPNALFTSGFTVSPLTLAQMKDGLTRAQNFFNTNYRLPNYVSYGTTKIPIADFQKIIATQGLKINTKIAVTSNATIASIMISASRFSYSGAASTGAAMERIGSGDCWAMSDWLFTHMRAAGIHARVLQYPTAYSSRHRSVQYLSNGVWVDAPYRTYFSTNMFNDCSGKAYGSVICQC